MVARHLAVATLVYLSVVVQSSLATSLSINGLVPWFPGIVLIVTILLHADVETLAWSASLGLIVDCLSAERIGTNMVITTFVSASLLFIIPDDRSLGAIMMGIYVFFGTWAWRLLSVVAQDVLENAQLDLFPILLSELGSAIYTAMIAVVTMALMTSIGRSIRKRGESSEMVLTNRWTMLTR
jgi:rod shape-determining protein MreD